MDSKYSKHDLEKAIEMLEEPHSRVLLSILELRSNINSITTIELVREYFEIRKQHGDISAFSPEDTFYTLYNRYRSLIK